MILYYIIDYISYYIIFLSLKIQIISWTSRPHLCEEPTKLGIEIVAFYRY